MRILHLTVACGVPLPALARAEISPLSAGDLVSPGYVNGATPLPDRPPADTPPARGGGLLETLQARLAGQPVVAVETGAERPAGDLPPFREDEKLLSRLQDVCEAFGTAERPMAPFAVRGAWALAPSERDAFVTDYTGVSTLDAMGRRGLWQEAMTFLTPTQVSEMALPQGIAFSALPPAAQERVRRALAPPMDIEVADESGNPDRKPLPPLDPGALRLQVRLRTYAAIVTFEWQMPGARTQSSVPVGELEQPPLPRIWPGGGYDAAIRLPSVRRVANTFKTSDLDAARLRAPIGVDGVVTVKDVLDRATAVTRLRFAASPQYKSVRVFVGSKQIPAGDALDAVRLALTASWRRLGDLYILAYEHDGLSAVQERIRENGADLGRQAMDANSKAQQDHVWAEFARRTGFAADDPLALTDKQRAVLFAPRDTRQEFSFPKIPWPEMTRGQQAAIRAGIVGREFQAPKADGSGYDSRPATDADLANAILDGHVRVEFRAQLPGGGWASLPQYWGRDLQPSDVFYMDRAKETPPRPANAPPMPMAMPVRREHPTLLPAKSRAIIAPILAPADIEPLADLMRARGFDTLFYPLLMDGRATLTSKAFPPDPSVSSGGFAAVARAMNRRGIRVVGCVDTLAWRKPGEKGHWLEKHPGWLDRDVLGRTFAESARAMAAADNRPSVAQPLTARGDLVRPAEPAVISRLETLAREAAALPETSGILFDAWSAPTSVTSPSRMNDKDWLVMTGYATADRLAAVVANGADPVDLPTIWQSSFPLTDMLTAPSPPPAAQPRFKDGQLIPPPPPPPGPDRLLLNRLAAIAPTPPRAWTTYAVAPPSGNYPTRFGHPAPSAPLPVKVALEPPPPYYRPDAAATSRIFRVPPRGAASAEMPWVDPSTPAIVVAEGSNPNVGRQAPPLALVVYDFRSAPGELMDSLRRVGLPETPEVTGH